MPRIKADTIRRHLREQVRSEIGDVAGGNRVLSRAEQSRLPADLRRAAERARDLKGPGARVSLDEVVDAYISAADDALGAINTRGEAWLSLAETAAIPDDALQARVWDIRAMKEIRVVADQDYAEALLGVIDSAEEAIDLIEFTFNSNTALNQQIIDRIVDRARDGVAVRVFVEANAGGPGEASSATLERLQQIVDDADAAGAPLDIQLVRDSPSVVTHTKAVVADQSRVLFGSTNLSFTSMTKNNETNLLIESPKVGAAFKRHMDALVSGRGALHPEKVVAGGMTVYFDGGAQFDGDAQTSDPGSALFQDLVTGIRSAAPGETIDLAMYYLRHVDTKALIRAFGGGGGGAARAERLLEHLGDDAVVESFLAQELGDDTRAIARVRDVLESPEKVVELLDALLHAAERGATVRIYLEQSGGFAPHITLANRFAENYLQRGLRDRGIAPDAITCTFDPTSKISHSKYLVVGERMSFLGTGNWYVGDFFKNHNVYMRINDDKLARTLAALHSEKVGGEG